MLQIENPVHGAVVNRRYGEQTDDRLMLPVSGTAPRFGQVTVNGEAADVLNERFEVVVPITEPEQDITAVFEGTAGRQEHTVRVVWDRHSYPRYRFSIDDNSFWLRDITREGYDSLFDCFYLQMLGDLNERYGVKFTLNIYYETADGWTLEDFPEDYKGEFQDNADWMVLAFHAWADKPDRPYQYATAKTLLSDMERVNEQIVRIAGAQTLAMPTVIHWAMLPPETLPELHEAGIEVLSIGLQRKPSGWDINYRLDPVICDHIHTNDGIKDFRSGIIFSDSDICCNRLEIDEIETRLEESYADPHRAEVLDLFTHEQYFWPFYHNYIPNHPERMDAAIRWVTERGYKPTFFHDGFLAEK